MDLATVQVRVENLKVEADIAVGARGNPTVTNTLRDLAEVGCANMHRLPDTKGRADPQLPWSPHHPAAKHASLHPMLHSADGRSLPFKQLYQCGLCLQQAEG